MLPRRWLGARDAGVTNPIARKPVRAGMDAVAILDVERDARVEPTPREHDVRDRRRRRAAALPVSRVLRESLGFAAMTTNSIEAVSDRDFGPRCCSRSR